MGEMMAAAGLLPDRVLCSGARRCRETWEHLAAVFNVDDVEYDDALHAIDAADYLDLIRLQDTAACLLVIGHNPMTEELAMALTADRTALGGLRPCGRFSDGWAGGDRDIGRACRSAAFRRQVGGLHHAAGTRRVACMREWLTNKGPPMHMALAGPQRVSCTTLDQSSAGTRRTSGALASSIST